MTSKTHQSTPGHASYPESIDEAIGRFEPVLQNRRVPLKKQEYHVRWLQRFVCFREGRDPRTLGTQDVRAFLEYLALERIVAASTRLPDPVAGDQRDHADCTCQTLCRHGTPDKRLSKREPDYLPLA